MFGICGFAMHQPHRNIAAQKHAALFCDAGEEGLRQRADARNRRDAQHKRGKEDAKTRKPAAQFAPRKPDRER